MTNETFNKIWEELSFEEKLEIFHDAVYAGFISDDDNIFLSEEFDEIFCNMSPSDIAHCVAFGAFTPFANYFRLNGYGNVVSMNDLEAEEEMEYFTDEILEYLEDGNADQYSAFQNLEEEEEEGEDVA